MGYPVYRRWNVLGSMRELVEEIRPDVAVAQPGQQIPLAKVLADLSIPTVVYLRDVEWAQMKGDPRDLKGAKFVSNSYFTAQQFLERFALSSVVIPPGFTAGDYQTTSSRENVTFINPHPLKGSDIAIQLVSECPDKQEDYLASLNKSHSNLTVVRATKRMKTVYGRAKIVLVPSKWKEAWGRVASEAQFSGIPVLASNVGGLPESIGPGGVLVNPDAPIDLWKSALRRIWDDEVYYAHLSAAAFAYSKRPEIDPDRHIDHFLEVMQAALGRPTV